MSKDRTGKGASDDAGGKPPAQGTSVGLWLCVGVAIGVSIGTVLDNLALGIGVGMALGVAVGAAVDARRKRDGA